MIMIQDQHDYASEKDIPRIQAVSAYNAWQLEMADDILDVISNQEFDDFYMGDLADWVDKAMPQTLENKQEILQQIVEIFGL